MCQFVKIVHYCGHVELLATPSGTKLCDSALQCQFCQGIDTAPPSCIPLPDDIDNDDVIFSTNVDLKACDDCCKKYGLISTDPKVYTDEDLQTLDFMQKELNHYLTQAQQLAETFEAEAGHRSLIPSIGNKWLEIVLKEDGPEKYKYLMLDKLEDASDWISHLYAYIEQDAPVELFRQVFPFVVNKCEKAVQTINYFGTLAEDLAELDLDTGLYLTRVTTTAEKLQENVQGEVELPDQFKFPDPRASTPTEFRAFRSDGVRNSGFGVPDTPSDSDSSDEGTELPPRERKARPNLTVEIHPATAELPLALPEIMHVPMSDCPREPMSPTVWAEQYRMKARMRPVPQTPLPTYSPLEASSNSCCFSRTH